MSETFPSITPNIPASKSPEAKILRNDFGDGYSQRIADGINSIRTSITLEWVVGATDRNTIVDFLEARAGYDAFLFPSVIYTPMDLTSTDLWTCTEWAGDYVGYNISIGNIWSYTLTFNKEFDLV